MMTDTSTVTIPLEVISKFQSLVKESLGGESVYIRAKETLQQMFADSEITSTDKAAAMGTIVSSMVNGITSSSMSIALEWAKYEKELALRKLEMDQQLLILEQEVLVKAAQLDQIETQNRLALVESKRMFGTGTFDVTTGAILSLTDEGKVINDMALVAQQTANAAAEETLLGSKLNESKAAIHKIVADTYVNFGSYTFSQNANAGFDSVTPTHPSSHNTLSDTQREIAIEQGKGYSYNAWANALTGSASMLGTAIASDYFDFSSGSTGDILLSTVLNCAKSLNAANSLDEEAIPTGVNNVGALPSVSAGIDQTVNEGTLVTLTAIAVDADGAIASYNWSQLSGTEVTLANAAVASTTFTAPTVDVTETLVFAVTVLDAAKNIVVNKVSITVTAV